jgi:ABC-2 type transport system permease protein
MTPQRTLAVTMRVLRQLRRDPRTVALLLIVPVLLMTLLRYVFDASPATFDHVGSTLIGIFPFTLMFVITSITMLRERTHGTLERLMSMPIGKADLLLGYGLAFALVAAVQGCIVAAVALGPLGVDVAGPAWLMLAFTVGNGVLGSSLGLFASAFARTEFQAVQFMPAFVLPQLLLCGLLAPRERMASALDAASTVLPMTWSVDGLQRVAAGSTLTDGNVVRDLVVVFGIALLALACGAATLRRRTS